MKARLLKFARFLRWRWVSAPRAMMRVRGGFAEVCAWCDTKNQADAWAEARGLKASHGICPACVPKCLGTEVIFDAGDIRRAAPTPQLHEVSAERSTALGSRPRVVVFSCREVGRR